MGEILTSLRRIVPARGDDDDGTPWRRDTGTAAQSDSAGQNQSAGLQRDQATQRAEPLRLHPATRPPSSLVRRSEDSNDRDSPGDVLHAILRHLERIAEKAGGADEHKPVAPANADLPGAQFELYRQHLTKELTTQVGKITEAMSQQGRSVTNALGASDRNMLGALESMTSSLIEALGCAFSAVTEDLARMEARLGQMNQDIQSAVDRPRRPASAAEVLSKAIAARQRSLGASPQIAGDRVPARVTDPAVSAASAEERGPRLSTRERKDAEGGSVDSGGLDLIGELLESISGRLETIDKLWTSNRGPAKSEARIQKFRPQSRFSSVRK